MKRKIYSAFALAVLSTAYAGAQKITLNNQSRWGFEHERLGWVEIREHINDGGEFSEGLASVRIGKNWGFINSLGQVQIQPRFQKVNEFHDGYAAAKLNGKWGIIDTEGSEAIPFEYDEIGGFYEGLAMAKKDGRYGFINADNNAVIGFNFVEATSFHDGLAAVLETEKGKYGFIDKNGNFKIPASFEKATAFEDGIAQVRTGGRKIFIDVNGTYYAKREEALLAAEDIARRNNARNVNNAASGISGDIPVWAEGGVAPGMPPAPNIDTENLREYLMRCGLDNSEISGLVSRKLKEWQRKGSYETTANYEARITKENVEQKRKELYQEYVDKYNAYIRPYTQAYRDAKRRDFLDPSHVFTLHEYDAESQRYRISSSKIGDIFVGVPANKAELFRDRWDKILKGLNCVFVPHGDDMRLSMLDFAGFKYVFDLPPETLATTLADANAGVSEDPAEGETPVDEAAVAEEKTRAAEEAPFVSDVDRTIPEGINPDASRTFAIIIGNEHYSESDCSDVPYAAGDAKSFREYCLRALGLPEKNIYFRTDATLNQMRGGVRWFGKIADAFGGDVKVIFYYAGHGIPNEAGTDSFLLPADGIPGDYESGYRLSRLYEDLGSIPAQSATVFLDACFSGAKRSGGMLMSARAVAIDVPMVEPIGNMVVFSAASGEETAMPYDAQRHGLFTYFLLKKLQETGGSATYRELADYISRNVRQFSVVENQKSQTPTVEPSYEMETSWELLTLNSEGVGIDNPSATVTTYSPAAPESESSAHSESSEPAPHNTVSAAAIAAATESAAPAPAEESAKAEEAPITLPITPAEESAKAEEAPITLPITPAEEPAKAEEAPITLPITPAEEPAKAEETPISLPITPM